MGKYKSQILKNGQNPSKGAWSEMAQYLNLLVIPIATSVPNLVLSSQNAQLLYYATALSCISGYE